MTCGLFKWHSHSRLLNTSVRDSIASWRSSASTKGSKNVNKMAPTNPIWLLAELSLSALTGASCSQAPSLCRPRCSQERRPRRRASLQLLHHCPLTEQGSRFSTQSMWRFWLVISEFQSGNFFLFCFNSMIKIICLISISNLQCNSNFTSSSPK